MKGKIKNAKGITLVALIITIIVLLILAVVAITSIRNSNIIKHAQNGREAYQQGKTNEIEKISEYEKYLDENNQNKFLKYGVVYSRINKGDEVDFVIINEDGINSYDITWTAGGTAFGDIPNTTYDDFRTSGRESGIKYKFVDLADAVDEQINIIKSREDWSEEEGKAEVDAIESIKNDASYCSKAIRSEIEDKGETFIDFSYFKDNYNKLIYSQKGHEYTVEDRFNKENKAKLLELINGDTLEEK